MLIEECNRCKYLRRMIAQGLGVRCTHEKNQNLKPKNEKLPQLPVLISHIKTCDLKEPIKTKSDKINP